MRYLKPTPTLLPDRDEHEPYRIEDGILVDADTHHKATTRQGRLEAEPVTPELRTRGVGCPPDDVDTSVHVRYKRSTT